MKYNSALSNSSPKGKFQMLQSARIFKALILVACASLAACGGGSSSSTGGSVGVQSNGSSSGSRTTDVSSGYTIAGGVSGAAGVSVKLMGLTANTTLTDSTGNFSFASVGTGSYTVAPTQTGRVFTPVSRAEAISSASLTNVTFSAASSAAPTYSISGTVNGAVAAGVVMTLNGVNVGSTITDLSGNYAFAGLVSGTYTVGAALPGYSFSTPLIISLDAQDSAANNFTSASSPSGLLQFTPSAPLPAATVGSAYSAKIVKSISGGTAPYHYQAGKLDDGTPPLGMIINPNGNLTGTADAAGKYDFTVCAVDDAGIQSACEPTSITVTGTAGPDPSPNPGPTPAASVDISASPATITAGNTSKLSWSAKNATGCTATGGWSGSKGTSGSAVIAPNSTTTYVLSCAGAGGTGHASIAVSVRPVGPPGPAPQPTVTLNASPATITSGSTADLTWSSTDASSCLASTDWAGTK
ncbi:MAG: hypothetical protein M3O06_04825, partial [Pseudomonadota bacterium]|nr:hypothetical protein [Pseudomonadota bacterium]